MQLYTGHMQVIASLYLNAPLTIDLLEKTHFPDSSASISTQFLTQWLKDADLFMGYVFI